MADGRVEHPGGIADQTAGEARRSITRKLAAAGFETPDLDSRRLIELATSLTAEALLMQPNRILSAGELSKLDALVSRRLAHEPISRIAGWREFYGRRFRVTPDTLDPRPETESLVEAVLQWVRSEQRTHMPLRILDIGTGTGCILLTLLAELKSAEGLGTDISEAALDVARGNANALGVAPRAAFSKHNAFEGIHGTFDIVVSNPPYIPSAEVGNLEKSVRNFDPAQALDGGDDGLDIYRQLADGLGAVLQQGLFVVEVGHDQASAVAQVFRSRFGQRIAAQHVLADLGGHMRCVAMEIHR